MAGVTVVYFKNPTGLDTAETYFRDAEIHISSYGVLVIHKPNNGKTIHAYSAGTWHSAKESN